jgi:hypothetical protein
MSTWLQNTSVLSHCIFRVSGDLETKKNDKHTYIHTYKLFDSSVYRPGNVYKTRSKQSTRWQNDQRTADYICGFTHLTGIAVNSVPPTASDGCGRFGISSVSIRGLGSSSYMYIFRVEHEKVVFSRNAKPCHFEGGDRLSTRILHN